MTRHPTFSPFPAALSSLAVLLLLLPGASEAQVPAAEQVAGAVLAAPESLRADATVLGTGGETKHDDVLTVLRHGNNGIICLADDPASAGFHVACYHESLDPFMALGRRLKADGADRSTIMDARYEALETGEIEAPAAALWSLTTRGAAPSADDAEGVRRLSVVYMPGAEPDELGLPTRPDGDSPWLMLPGTPWAHVMIPR